MTPEMREEFRAKYDEAIEIQTSLLSGLRDEKGILISTTSD